MPGQAHVPKVSSKPSLQKDQKGGHIMANLAFLSKDDLFFGLILFNIGLSGFDSF